MIKFPERTEGDSEHFVFCGGLIHRGCDHSHASDVD